MSVRFSVDCTAKSDLNTKHNLHLASAGEFDVYILIQLAFRPNLRELICATIGPVDLTVLFIMTRTGGPVSIEEVFLIHLADANHQFHIGSTLERM